MSEERGRRLGGEGGREEEGGREGEGGRKREREGERESEGGRGSVDVKQQRRGWYQGMA